MTTRFVDPADLHIETDDAGFILGQSVIGDALGSEATVWLERSGQIHSLTMDRSVDVDQGVVFNPVTPTLSLVMAHSDFSEGAMEKRLRVRYKNDILFVGVIKSVDVGYSISNNKSKTSVKVKALGITERFNRQKLDDFARPEETAGLRAASTVVSTDIVIETNNCNRLMAARGSSTVKMMTVLKETANTQLARFYINKNNVLVMDGDPAPAPVVMFSDDPAVTGRSDYRSVTMRQDVENVITAITVKSQRSLKDAEGEDYQLEASARDLSAVVTHEEVYEADVPLRQNQLDAWASSFPLRGSTRMEPMSLTCAWQDSLSALELTHLVSIQKDGRVYLSGVKGIKYDIKAAQDGLIWTVNLDLMPGHLVQYTPVIAPSDVQAFRAVAINDHRVDLSWRRPSAPNGLNGYEIRYLTGPTPPATRSQGTLLTTLAADQVMYSHTGAASNTQYSYTIWATTSNASLSSNPVTAGATTPETIPSAVQGLTATKVSTVVHRLNWSAPATPGTDIDHYMIRAANGYAPASNGGTLNIDVPLGTTTWTTPAGYLGRNQSINWAVWAVTRKGAVSPVARVVQNTNEAIPTAVSNLSLVANNYNTITGSWTHSTNSADFSHYRVVRLENAYRVPTSSDGPQYGTGATSITLNPVSMAAHHDVSVFPITVGGLIGEGRNAFTDTPQGVFEYYHESEATWAQSYRQNGAPSSLSSGSAQNLYYGYGDSFNGHQRSMVGFNIPANVQGAEVWKVEMHIYNLHTYNNAGADVDFGVHGAGGPPGTWTGGATGLARYRTNKPGWLRVDVTAWAAPHFRNGGKGFFLGPNQSNANAYYGYASGTAGQGPRPVIKIWYRRLGG